MKKLIVIAFFLPLCIFAQKSKASLEKEARELVREGTMLYSQEKYADAEVAFKKAIENAPDYEIAKYNLGNALFQQNRNKEAIEQYQLITKTSQDKFMKAQSFHNIGNSYFVDKDYQNSIEAYKNSLRTNPKDDETRYNLALAQKMLEDQQNEDQNQDKNDENQDQDNKDNQDQNQDKKEGDDEKDDDKKNDEENQDGDDKKDPEKDKKDQEQKEQPQQGKLSPQQVQQLLEAMNNEEKKTQEKMNAKKERGKKVKQEKDW